MWWWNEFWLRTHEIVEFSNAEPNGGHMALRDIAAICSVKIITQNIDRSARRRACLPSPFGLRTPGAHH
jgi:NAD-dependent SIR2 family protein deacetylase